MKRNRPKTEKEKIRDEHFKSIAHKFTSEEAREMQAKGVITRRKHEARKKTLQEIAKWLGNMPVNGKKLLDQDEILELDSAKQINMTVNEAMVLAQYQKALAGDTQSATFIRDTAGEKPAEQVEVSGPTIEDYAKSHKVKF